MSLGKRSSHRVAVIPSKGSARKPHLKREIIDSLKWHHLHQSKNTNCNVAVCFPGGLVKQPINHFMQRFMHTQPPCKCFSPQHLITEINHCLGTPQWVPAAEETTPERPPPRLPAPPPAPGRPARGAVFGENGVGLDDPDVEVGLSLLGASYHCCYRRAWTMLFMLQAGLLKTPCFIDGTDTGHNPHRKYMPWVLVSKRIAATQIGTESLNYHQFFCTFEV